MGKPMPLSWHEENLQNLIKSHERYVKHIQSLEYQRHQCENAIRELRGQIIRARSEGKIRFDSDRYNRIREKHDEDQTDEASN
jgi:hypothetical protein